MSYPISEIEGVGPAHARKLAKADIKEISLDPLKSVMPDDLSEAMTVKDYQDVLSFLLLLKGE